MWDKCWDFVVDSLMKIFLPLICSYFAFQGSLFFNAAYDKASGLEFIGNQLLAPSQYLFMGQTASLSEDGTWEFSPRFNYERHFTLKTTASIVLLVPGFVLGSTFKAIALIDRNARLCHSDMLRGYRACHIRSNFAYYRSLGIQLPEQDALEPLKALGYLRRPGDEALLSDEKEALQAIGALLTEARIPWWLDCGSCLGAYRYGGVIPWDEDIDIAVFQPDFDNIRRILNQLDPKRYMVQDWSTREHPKSYLKVYIRKTKRLIDIYHFAIDENRRQASYVFSLENAWFFPTWWKKREMRCKAPASFAMLFPLKKCTFDNVMAFVPNDTEGFLRRYYGNNLAPAKKFNTQTSQYEKDITHPYWNTPHVH